MAGKSRNWLQRPNVSWHWAVAAVAIWTVALLILDKTELAKDLQNKIASPFDFRMRESLKRSPKVDQRIKLYAIDDSTVSWLGGPSPTFEQWAILLESIAAQKPKAIIIDAMFTIASIPEGREKETKRLIEKLEKQEVPIIVGSFIAPRALRYREPLDTKAPNFSLSRWVLESSDYKAKDLPLAKGESEYVYGPDPILRKAFTHVGHILYGGDGSINPFVSIRPDTIVPHFMMLLEPRPKFVNGALTARNHSVPLFRDGSLPLNFTTYGNYLNATRPLRPLLVRAFKGEPQPITSEDYVYILPLLYTGNTDFKQTPFGAMPGGFAHLAVLNSLLTNDWLKPIWIKEILIALSCMLGAWVAVRCGPLVVASSLFFGILGWLGVVIYAFSFHNLVLPWVLPAIGFAGTLVTIFVEKSRMAEKKSQFIRHALDGVISPRTLSSIAKNPQHLNFEARERVVTIMFIDVVGFSLMAENQMPRLAFDQLKEILSGIVRTVHEHGGIVNKYLGDGLLCFFGYSLETDESTFDHAEKSFECAVAIQKDNLVKTLSAYDRGQPVYPLRIGINTSSVFLGNLGTEERLDFTIVGNGVNFAKRLEAACETHSILMSSTTRELIDPMGTNKLGIRKQNIQIKHHSDMVEAYIYDPFHDNPQLREKAIQAHVSSTNLAREEERWRVNDPSLIIVNSSVGRGQLAHVSRHGISLLLPTQAVNHAILRVQFDAEGGLLQNELREANLGNIDMEVQWSYEEDSSFLHGLKFKNLTDTQIHLLLRLLKHYTRQEDADQTAEPMKLIG